MTNETLNGMNDMDNLLDGTLDDLADMPEFKPFPAGAHRATIQWDYSKFAAEKIVELKITAIETVELANPEDTPVKAGDTTNQRLMFLKKDKTPNEIAQGQFKNLIKPLTEHFGTANNRETMDASNGAEVLVITKIRADKRDANDIKYYTDVTTLSVV
jgi:hypothetical protein